MNQEHIPTNTVIDGQQPDYGTHQFEPATPEPPKQLELAPPGSNNPPELPQPQPRQQNGLPTPDNVNGPLEQYPPAEAFEGAGAQNVQILEQASVPKVNADDVKKAA